jgi:hypothetical protein
MSKIKIVAHPETKAMFTETANPEWVKCQLQSEEIVVNNGVISVQKRVAFPLLSAKVLPLLKSLKSGDTFPVNGKIVRKVTSTPQYENQKQVVNPSTGEVMGYYQSYTFTTDMAAYDVDERIAVASTQVEEFDAEKAAAAELAQS